MIPKRILPKWKQGQYSGDPLEWPEWSGMFKATVGKSSITDDEKMNHLKAFELGKQMKWLVIFCIQIPIIRQPGKNRKKVW